SADTGFVRGSRYRIIRIPRMGRHVGNVNKPFPTQQPFLDAERAKRLAEQFRESCRHRVSSDQAEVLTIVSHQAAMRGPAEAVRLFQYRVKDGGEVAGRAVDDPQHLGGCGLLV